MGCCCSSDNDAASLKHRKHLRPTNASIFDDDYDDNVSSTSASSHVAPRTWRWERHGESVASIARTASGRLDGDESKRAKRSRAVSIRSPTAVHLPPSRDEQEKEQDHHHGDGDGDSDRCCEHPTIIDPQQNSSKYPTGATSNIMHSPGGLLDGEYFSITISPALAAAISSACKLVDDAECIATTSDHCTGLLDFAVGNDVRQRKRKEQQQQQKLPQTSNEEKVPLPWPWIDDFDNADDNRNDDDAKKNVSGDDDDEDDNNNDGAEGKKKIVSGGIAIEPTSKKEPTSCVVFPSVSATTTTATAAVLMPSPAPVKNNVASCYSIYLGGTSCRKANTSSVGWSAYDLCISADVDYAMKERASYNHFAQQQQTHKHKLNYMEAMNLQKPKQQQHQQQTELTKSIAAEQSPVPARCVAAIGVSVRRANSESGSSSCYFSSALDSNAFLSSFAAASSSPSVFGSGSGSGSGVGGGDSTTASVGSIHSIAPVKTATNSGSPQSSLSASSPSQQHQPKLEQMVKVKIVESFAQTHEKERGPQNASRLPTAQVIAKVVLLVHQGRLCITTDDTEREDEQIKAKRRDFFASLASPGIRTPRGGKLPDFEHEHDITETDTDGGGGDTQKNLESEDDDFCDEFDASPLAPSPDLGHSRATSTTYKGTRRKSFNNSSVEGKFVGLESAHISDRPSAQWYLHLSGLAHPCSEIHDADATVLFESVAHPGFFLTVDVPNIDLRRFALPSMSTPAQWNLSLTIRTRELPLELIDKLLLPSISSPGTDSSPPTTIPATTSTTTTTTTCDEVMRERIASAEMSEIEKYLDDVTTMFMTTTTTTTTSPHYGSNQFNINNSNQIAQQLQNQVAATICSKTVPVPLPPCPFAVRDMTQSFRLVHPVIKTSTGNVDLPTGRESSSGIGPWQLPWFGANAVKLGVFDVTGVGLMTSSAAAVPLKSQTSSAFFAGAASRASVASPNKNCFFVECATEKATASEPGESSPRKNTSSPPGGASLLPRPTEGIFDLTVSSLFNSATSSLSSSFYIIPDALFHVKIVSAQDPRLMLAATGSFAKVNVKSKKIDNLDKKKKKQQGGGTCGNPLSVPTSPTANQNFTHSPTSLSPQKAETTTATTTTTQLSKKFLEVALCTKSALKKVFGVALGSEVDGEDADESYFDVDENQSGMFENGNAGGSENSTCSILADDASLWRISFVEGACPVRSEVAAAQRQVEKFNVAPLSSTHNNNNNKGTAEQQQQQQEQQNSSTTLKRQTSSVMFAATLQGYKYLQQPKHIVLVNKLFPSYCLTFSKSLNQWMLAVLGGGGDVHIRRGDDAKNNIVSSGDGRVSSGINEDDDNDDVSEENDAGEFLLQAVLFEPATMFAPSASDLANDRISKNIIIANRLTSTVPTQLMTRAKSVERTFILQKWFKALFSYSAPNNSHFFDYISSKNFARGAPTSSSSLEVASPTGLPINLPQLVQCNQQQQQSSSPTNAACALSSATIPLPADTLSLGIVPVMSKIGFSGCLVRIVVFHDTTTTTTTSPMTFQRNREQVQLEQQQIQQQHQQSDLIAQVHAVDAGERCCSPAPLPQANEQEHLPPQSVREKQFQSKLNSTSSHPVHSRPQSSLSIVSEISHGGATPVSRHHQQHQFSTTPTTASINLSKEQQSNVLNRVTGLVNSQAGWVLQWTSSSVGARGDEDDDEHEAVDRASSTFPLPPSRIITEQLNNCFLLVPILFNSKSSRTSSSSTTDAGLTSPNSAPLQSFSQQQPQKVNGDKKIQFLLMHLASCTSSPVRKPMFLTYVPEAFNASVSTRTLPVSGGLTLAPLVSTSLDGQDQIFSVDLV